MLKSLHLKNFTVFPDAEFQFAANINVIVGDNGAGKTHILKVAYSTMYASFRQLRQVKRPFNNELAEKLIAVFKPDTIGNLVSDGNGAELCEIKCRFSDSANDIAYSFGSSNDSDVKLDTDPATWIVSAPVYMPTHELITISRGFVSLYDTTVSPFEETWRDTCQLLGALPVRGKSEREIQGLLEPLENTMGGKVVVEHSGRFYLEVGGVKREMHLVAEGLRKLAMLAQLISVGALLGQRTLFWDEPEANLNPKLIKLVARTILHLGRNGIQVFIASHSLFLLRELDILLRSDEFKDVNARFFGLHRGDDGVEVMQGDSVDDIGEIDALQEELSQSDRYLDLEHAA